MNLYVDTRALQMAQWRGQQFYTHRILREMIDLDLSHRFHLHFGWQDWHPKIDELLTKPNVSRHDAVGKYWSHLAVPVNMLCTGSRVYYRMYNEDQRVYTPLPGKVAILILDNGRHIYSELYGNGDPVAARQRTNSYIHKFDAIVTISQAMKNELMDLFQLPSERISVAPCALTHFVGAAEEEIHPANLPANRAFFLVVNPGGTNKNWQQALAGFALYVEDHPDDDVMLVLAGGLAAEEPKIRAAIEANAALRDRVLCTGYISKEKLSFLYRNARAAIYVSRYEGFGIPILETMSFGLPVIVSDIPVFREVAGEAAVYVPLDQPDVLADALDRLQYDTALRTNVLSKGPERLSFYSWRKSAQITLDALERLE